MDFAVVGQPQPNRGQEPSADFAIVSPDYFKTLKIPLVRGRIFDASDVTGKTSVITIAEQLADRCFPGQDPIGQQISDDPHRADSPKHTIVGLVRTVRRNDLASQPKLP